MKGLSQSMTDAGYMQVPEDVKLVKFETYELEKGDVITLYRATIGEVARYLITSADHSIVGCIVLLDRTGNNWTGNYMHFAKCELDTDRWRKLVSTAA
tara:strand:+ start:86 stop:379 length:294 start_codon:yes stop_codon:yes gene_type:complete